MKKTTSFSNKQHNGNAKYKSVEKLAIAFAVLSVASFQVANADDGKSTKGYEKGWSESGEYKEAEKPSLHDTLYGSHATCTTRLIQRSTITCSFTGNGNLSEWGGGVLDNEGNLTISTPDWSVTESHELYEEQVETDKYGNSYTSIFLVSSAQSAPYYIEGELEDPNNPGQAAVLPDFNDVCDTENAQVVTTQTGGWAPQTTTTVVADLEYYVLGSTKVTPFYCLEASY